MVEERLLLFRMVIQVFISFLQRLYKRVYIHPMYYSFYIFLHYGRERQTRSKLEIESLRGPEHQRLYAVLTILICLAGVNTNTFYTTNLHWYSFIYQYMYVITYI